MFETIAAGDVMLHHPYESFEPVLRLHRGSRRRSGRGRHQTGPLPHRQKIPHHRRPHPAAENGKHVTALVELKARFDEARNLDRADELQRAGAQIVYGVKGLKTHAKICMIVRRESGHLRRYVHLGTGNYNENHLPPLHRHLLPHLQARIRQRRLALLQRRLRPLEAAALPAPRPRPHRDEAALLDLITGEAERAKQGLPARIIAKVNSLQDPDIIAALYKASRAGVEIKLNVRGICCLKPGDESTRKTSRSSPSSTASSNTPASSTSTRAATRKSSSPPPTG
jgi:polyphosphate kinase